MNIKVLNNVYPDIAKNLFSIISDLSRTPFDEEIYNFMEESKKTLRTLIMSSPEQKKEGMYNYYKLDSIIYYQNGLCKYNDKCIDLGSFDSSNIDENIREVPVNAKDLIKYADDIAKIYPLVAYQIYNLCMPDYKFKRLYNGSHGSLERIVHNCEIIKKELDNPNAQMNDRKKEMYNDGIKVIKDLLQILTPNDKIVIIDTKKLEEFAASMDENLFIKKDLTGDYVEKGSQLIEFLENQNDEINDIMRRLRVMNE